MDMIVQIEACFPDEIIFTICCVEADTVEKAMEDLGFTPNDERQVSAYDLPEEVAGDLLHIYFSELPKVKTRQQLEKVLLTDL